MPTNVMDKPSEFLGKPIFNGLWIITNPEILTDCNFCGDTALIDGRTTMAGKWANMCSACYMAYGVGLGTGCGSIINLELALQLK